MSDQDDVYHIMKVINVADTETTGFSPPPNGDIVEIAVTPLHVYYTQEGGLVDIKIQPTVSTLADPGISIDLGAMAIHHITPAMLKAEKAQSAKTVKARYADMKCDYWAWHNAAFDMKFFQANFGRTICTMKAAQVIFPDAPSHKNQILRYWLNLDAQMKADRYGDAHRAGFDTYVTAHLLSRLIQANKMTLDDMADLMEPGVASISIGKIPFGKHKGVLWKDAPKSYLLWLRDSTKDDAIKATCIHYLKAPR